MTRIESIIQGLNKVLNDNELKGLVFRKHGICTRVSNKQGNAVSFIYDILAADWVIYDAKKPVIYHILQSEKIGDSFRNSLNTEYKLSTGLIFQRKGNITDSQVAEWFKNQMLTFAAKSDNLNASISGIFTPKIDFINYNSELNYNGDYPNTGEVYTPAIGALKIDWNCELTYNNCTPNCETENYCIL